MEIDNRIDQLYGLPLGEFTERRNAAAKEIKDAGDKDTAAAVKKLAKPTLAAWVVNQLARREPQLMQELISVQDRLASTASAKDLRELTHARRELVSKLKRSASKILEEGDYGTGAATLQHVSQTLLAGATEEEQQLLLEGRLTRDLSSSGLEQVWGFEAAEVDGAEDEEAGREARQEAEDLTKQAAEAQQRALALEAEVERLKTALEATEKKAAEARREAQTLDDRAAGARRAAGLED